jgi:hypothetical protein
MPLNLDIDFIWSHILVIINWRGYIYNAMTIYHETILEIISRLDDTSVLKELGDKWLHKFLHVKIKA